MCSERDVFYIFPILNMKRKPRRRNSANINSTIVVIFGTQCIDRVQQTQFTGYLQDNELSLFLSKNAIMWPQNLPL